MLPADWQNEVGNRLTFLERDFLQMKLVMESLVKRADSLTIWIIATLAASLGTAATVILNMVVTGLKK